MSGVSRAGGPSRDQQFQAPVETLNRLEKQVQRIYERAIQKVEPTTPHAAYEEVEQVCLQAKYYIETIDDDINKAKAEIKVISGTGIVGNEIAKSAQKRISYWSQVKEDLTSNMKNLSSVRERGAGPETITRLKNGCLETMRKGYENDPRKVEQR